jgi:hypothetical protein
MSSRRAALVLAFAALSGGALGACGGSNTFVDSVPKSTPDLTVPSNGAGLPPVSTTSTTSTTGTTTTPTTTTGAAAPATTTGATSTPATGGTPSGGTGTTTPAQTTNTTGGFSDFCQQNPGACGQ